MENYEFANSSKPSMSFIHPIECKRSQDSNVHLYVRTDETFTGDQRLYDIGAFQLAVQGMAFTGGVIGELWCTFEVEFFKPKITLGSGCNYAHYQLQNTTVTNSLVLGTQPTAIQLVDSIGITWGTVAGASQLQFPLGTVGTFLITLVWYGTSAALVAPTVTGTSTVVMGPTFFNNTSQYATVANPTTGTILPLYFMVTVIPLGSGVQSFINFNTATLPTVVSYADLQVVEMPYVPVPI